MKARRTTISMATMLLWSMVVGSSSNVVGDEAPLSICQVIDVAKRSCTYLDTDKSMSAEGFSIVDGKVLGSPTPVEDAASIKTLSEIRGITLRRDARNEDLMSLARLPELRYVNAAYCYFITDVGIASLERHPNIRIVDLYRNEPLEHPYTLPEGFVLSQKPNLTEKSLRSLATIPHLRSLSILENRFTFSAVKELFICKSLRRLALRGNKLAHFEIEAIRGSLPDCIVSD